MGAVIILVTWLPSKAMADCVRARAVVEYLWHLASRWVQCHLQHNIISGRHAWQQRNSANTRMITVKTRYMADKRSVAKKQRFFIPEGAPVSPEAPCTPVSPAQMQRRGGKPEQLVPRCK